MKTKKELNELKNEYEVLTNKLQTLTEEELSLVTGGVGFTFDTNDAKNKEPLYEHHFYTDKEQPNFEPKF